jgi:hypothetical protein
MYHDQLMRVVDSQEAQSKVDLYEVLQRRNFGDGQIMLNALHNRGLLKKVAVDQIKVQPMPNRTAPLREVNDQIRGTASAPTPTKAAPAPEVAQPKEAPPVGSDEQKRSLAETKLLTARLMEEDAKKLRDEAYRLDPSLKKGGRPSKDQKKKAEEISAD